MKRALYFLIPAAFILAIMAPGCYTVVMHPSDEGGFQADQTSDCTRCHGDYQEYPYGYYYAPYPSYWWEHSDYAYYYAYPWWWSYYDYPYLPGDYHYSGTSKSGTKFDRREGPGEPAAPPYSTRSKDEDSRDDYLVPSSYNQSSGQLQPTPPSTGTARTQPSSTDDEAHADDPPSKIERTSRQDTKTDSGSNAGQNDANRDRPATDTKKDTGKKKSRRDGGGK